MVPLVGMSVWGDWWLSVGATLRGRPMPLMLRAVVTRYVIARYVIDVLPGIRLFRD